MGNASMRIKLAAPFSIIILVIVVFQYLYYPARQSDSATDELQEKATSLTSVLANSVQFAYEFDDQVKANDILEGGLFDDDMLYIGLFNEDGTEFAAHHLDRATRINRQYITRSGPNLEIDDAGHILNVYIALEGERVTLEGKAQIRGTLVAGYSMQSIEQARETTQSTGLRIGAIILLGGLLVSIGVGSSWARRVGRMSRRAEQLAEGNLAIEDLDDASNDEIGRLGKSFNRMVANQRELVTQIAGSAVRINTTAGQILASCRQQEKGATEQSTAVEETRRTMDTLLDASRDIARASSDVLSATDSTYQNNQAIADGISKLSEHTQRIGEILEVIKDIANKSDLLALNAALEGTKSGAVGRGFSLVATQMQRLAENVMQSARDIKVLTTDIRQSTNATVLATEDATRRAGEATQAAKRISLIAQQQQSGAEQVSVAMEDVHVVARQNTEASRQTLEATSELVELSEGLQSLVGRFHLEA